MRIALLLASLLLFSCANEDATRRTLVKAGFTDIRVGGRAWSCGDSDTFCTKFTARNPAGAEVSGAVGCGFWMKGCTVRF